MGTLRRGNATSSAGARFSLKDSIFEAINAGDVLGAISSEFVCGVP